MNKRLSISLAAFVGWLLITVVGGRMHTGEAPLLQSVTRGLGWPFLLALVVRQQWRDVGLNQLTTRRSLLLTWLPMLYIGVGLGLAVVFGLPPLGVLLWILFNTFLVGLSEELMFRGVLLQAFRRTVSIWPAVALTTLAFGAIHEHWVLGTLAGAVFAFARLRRGRLSDAVLAHAVANAVVAAAALSGRWGLWG